MSRLAIITARGGSKRIPSKNIKPFLGKPILAYSIEAAINSGLFDEVMVSTDSEEIAAIAKEYGAEVPFYRSTKTSDDYATTADVLHEVLEEYEKRGKTFEVACCLYPTAPFVTSKKLVTAVEMLESSELDTVFPVVPFSFPPQRGMIVVDGRLTPFQPEHMNTRSQDLTPMYHDVGQFYVFKTEPFKGCNNLMQGRLIPYVMPEMEVQDIDNMSDWKIAEIKYQAMIDKE